MSDNLLSIPCTTIKGEQKTLADVLKIKKKEKTLERE
jgi:hypothetical protein